MTEAIEAVGSRASRPQRAAGAQPVRVDCDYSRFALIAGETPAIQ